jgi:hypothetical protein
VDKISFISFNYKEMKDRYNGGMNVLISLTLVLISAGCSLAPMTTPRSAQTIGENKNRIEFLPLPVLGVNYQRGITPNLDAGFALEQQLAPLASGFFKYAFINQPENFSLAALGGVFYGSGLVESKGFYLGPITSYRKKWFEVYFHPRYNYVQWDGSDLSNDEDDSLVIDIIKSASKVTLQYLQADIGMSFYTSPRYHIGLGASYLYFFSTSYVNGSAGGWVPEIFMGWSF